MCLFGGSIDRVRVNLRSKNSYTVRLSVLPKTRAEVDLSGDWCNTLSGSKFLLQND